MVSLAISAPGPAVMPPGPRQAWQERHRYQRARYGYGGAGGETQIHATDECRPCGVLEGGAQRATDPPGHLQGGPDRTLDVAGDGRWHVIGRQCRSDPVRVPGCEQAADNPDAERSAYLEHGPVRRRAD